MNKLIKDVKSTISGQGLLNLINEIDAAINKIDEVKAQRMEYFEPVFTALCLQSLISESGIEEINAYLKSPAYQMASNSENYDNLVDDPFSQILTTNLVHTVPRNSTTSIVNRAALTKLSLAEVSRSYDSLHPNMFRFFLKPYSKIRKSLCDLKVAVEKTHACQGEMAISSDTFKIFGVIESEWFQEKNRQELDVVSQGNTEEIIKLLTQ